MSKLKSIQFGVVQIGPMRFAVSILHLSEVFHIQQAQELPQKSGLLREGIDLRGRLIPVLDLHALTRSAQGDVAAELGIVVENDSRQLAIYVDDVVGICAIDPDEIHEMSPPADGSEGLFNRHFQHEGRYISIIEVDRILQMKGVFSIVPRKATQKTASAHHAPVLTFIAGGALFSVPAVEVYAAIPKRPIQQSAITMGPVLGEITYHDRRIPVLCPIQVLGLGTATQSNASEVVALRFPDNTVLGFAVDAIQEIGSVTSGKRADVPDWRGHQNYIQEIMIRDDDEQVFAINTQKLFQSVDLCEIAQLSVPETPEPEVKKVRASEDRNIIYEKMRYLVVEAGSRVAIPLAEVNRIIAIPDKLTTTYEADIGFCGYFAKTDQTIGLFDLAICQGHQRVVSDDSKVLLTGKSERQSGFEVARVVGIELSEWREKPSTDAAGTGPALVQLGNGKSATVLPICSLTETLHKQSAKRPAKESSLTST